ncbi:MAG: hypothetical protein ACLFR1_06725, partial [Spirochaetia bacterium]
MKQRVLFLVLLTICISSVFAQEYSIYGSIGTSVNYRNRENTDSETEHIFTGELTAEANHRISVENTEFFAHHRAVFSPNRETEHTIYQAYVMTTPVSWLTVTAGKQRVQWGTGYYFTPSDGLHPADQGPDQETGFQGLELTLTPRFSFSVSTFLSLDNALSTEPADFWTDLRYGIRAEGFLAGIDWAASCVYQYDDILRPGLGFSIDVLNTILSFEAGLELHNQADYPSSEGTQWEEASDFTPYPIIDTALQKTISADDFTLSFVSEYLYSHLGYSGSQTEDLYSTTGLMLLGNGEITLPHHLGRHYFVQNIGISLMDTFSTDNTIVLNAADPSAMVSHSFSLLYFRGMD